MSYLVGQRKRVSPESPRDLVVLEICEDAARFEALDNYGHCAYKMVRGAWRRRYHADRLRRPVFPHCGYAFIGHILIQAAQPPCDGVEPPPIPRSADWP